MAEPSWLVGLFQADSTLAGLPLAFLLGATVGAEREWRQSPASLRACTLICVAAAGFADLAITRVDPGNLGAAFGPIAQGVGFLGAGAILREGAVGEGSFHGSDHLVRRGDRCPGRGTGKRGRHLADRSSAGGQSDPQAAAATHSQMAAYSPLRR